MHIIQMLVLGFTCVTVVVPISFCFGQDNGDYWDQFIDVRETMALAAARANPVLVKTLNEEAMRCVSGIQSELAQFAQKHAVLAGIETEKLELHNSRKAHTIGYELLFMKNTKLEGGGARMRQTAQKDGIVLVLAVNDMFVFYRPYLGVTRSYNMLVQGIEIIPYFFLELGEQNKNIEQSICEIIDRHMRLFRNDLKKLQGPKDVPYHERKELAHPQLGKYNRSKVVR